MRKLLLALLLLPGLAWGTVSVETLRSDYNCDGSQTTYTYAFQIFQDADLDVIVQDGNGDETTLVLNTDYTVSGAGDASGTITLLDATECASGETLHLLRDIDLQQSTDYIDGGLFSAETLEQNLDRLTLLTQQQQDQINRSLRLSKSSQTDGELPASLAANRASKAVGFGTSGAPVLYPLNSSGSLDVLNSLRQTQTATAGQTVFVTGFTYTPGLNEVTVYVNGVRQSLGDSAYTETNSRTITMSEGLDAGDVVEFVFNEWTGTDATDSQLRTDLIALSAGNGLNHVQTGAGVLATDITAIGSREVVLVIGADQTVSTNVTIPANVTLRFVRGAELTISAGKTLTVNGIIDAGPWQIFSGSGLVSFGAGSFTEIRPEWWGAKADGIVSGATNSTAFTAMMTALPVDGAFSRAPRIRLADSGAYLMAGTVAWDITKRCTVDFRRSVLRYESGETGTVVRVRAGAVQLIDLAITRGYGSGAATTELVGTALHLSHTVGFRLVRPKIQGFAKGIYLYPDDTSGGVSYGDIYSPEIYDCVYSFYAQSVDSTHYVSNIYVIGGRLSTFAANFSDASTTSAVYIHAGGTHQTEAITFYKTTIEEPTHRKVFCDGKRCRFIDVYWDQGSYDVVDKGEMHRRTGETGFAWTDGSKVLTKTAHGMDAYFGVGDVVFGGSNGDEDVRGYYYIMAIDANTVTLDRAMSGTGTDKFNFSTANIEFGPNAVYNAVINGSDTKGQAIADKSTGFTNTLEAPDLGVRYGALNPPATRWLPAGTPSRIWPRSPAWSVIRSDASYDVINHMGNAGDSDTISTELWFSGTDSGGRVGGFAAIRGDKEGRTNASPYGGLKFKTRPSGGELTSIMELDSAGRVIINSIPTSATGLPSGALWSNSGVLTIVP